MRPISVSTGSFSTLAGLVLAGLVSVCLVHPVVSRKNKTNNRSRVITIFVSLLFVWNFVFVANWFRERHQTLFVHKSSVDF